MSQLFQETQESPSLFSYDFLGQYSSMADMVGASEFHYVALRLDCLKAIDCIWRREGVYPGKWREKLEWQFPESHCRCAVSQDPSHPRPSPDKHFLCVRMSVSAAGPSASASTSNHAQATGLIAQGDWTKNLVQLAKTAELKCVRLRHILCCSFLLYRKVRISLLYRTAPVPHRIDLVFGIQLAWYLRMSMTLLSVAADFPRRTCFVATCKMSSTLADRLDLTHRALSNIVIPVALAFL